MLSSFYAKTQNLKDVTVGLKWKHHTENIGFYMAIEKGYYKDVGLNVKLKEFVADSDEKTDYSVVRPTSLIDISNGKDLVYLFALYQSSPLVLLTDKSSNIKTLKDIKNKKIMTAKRQLQDASIASLLAVEGILPKDIKPMKQSFDVADLLNGKADLMTTFITYGPFALKQIGGTPVVFNSKDYGFDFYDEIVVTSKKYLSNHPKEVRNFKQATLKGYKYAFNHPKESVELVYNRYNTTKRSKKVLHNEMREFKKLAYYKTKKLGTITKERLEKSYYAYRLLGLIHKNIDLDSIIYKDTQTDTKLDAKEREYLQNKKTIKICSDPNWLPYDKLDKNGNYIGITPDYLKLIGKFLNVKMEYVKVSNWAVAQQLAKEKKCDILTSAAITSERKKYLNFTTPYAKFPIVVATRLDVHFINDLNELNGKKVGISKGASFTKKVKKNFPKIKIIDMNDIGEGLEKLSNGDIFALMEAIPSVAYHLQKHRYQNIKISGKAYGNNKISIGVRNDDLALLNVFQKAINNITSAQKQTIFNSWVGVKYENGVDYTLIVKIIVTFVAMLILLLLWLRKLNSMNNTLKLANKKIDEKNQALDILATTDKLTKIYNRLKLDDILTAELNRSERYKHKIGICILDIDDFKTVNDTYGHQTGDEVLKIFANILKSHIRKTDYVGRWGGEEFLILCLEIDEENFCKLMEKIRLHIQNFDFPKKHKVTASFGLSMYKENDTLETITKRADDALYKAKRTGKDKVIVV